MKKEIIAYFKKNPHASVKSKQLAKDLGIFDDFEYHSMKAQLHTLLEENVLVRIGKRFSIPVPDHDTGVKLTGVLELTRQGFGFVLPENKKTPDIFIASRNLNTAMHGDKVEVALFAKQKKTNKNLEGEIVKIIKRKWDVISGILRQSKSVYYVIPDIQELQCEIYIDSNSIGTAKEGDKVLVGDINWVSPKLGPEGKIIKVFTDKLSPETEYLSIMTEFGLPGEFPGSVLTEVQNLDISIPQKEIKTRVDMRDEVVVTIDPVDAKDFDDALSIKKLENGNFRVGIHIADVGHYIERKGEIDNEARQRGNSVYLSGKVIPMLPELLSNNVCSLVPGKDRLTFSVFVDMTSRGKINSYEIKKSIINN